VAVEGRTHKPVIDHVKCGACAVCLDACPAEIIPELRREDESLRGRIYSSSNYEAKVNAAKEFPLPRCQAACPIRQDVRGYMALIAEGRYKEALKLVRESNPIPSVCGYVCHRPCERACTRGKVDDPLSIRSLKRYIADCDDGAMGSANVAKSNGSKVAIVGGGPAGLTAAHDLAEKGYAVEVIESFREPGGMLAWAIPEFRLPRHALRRDVDYIRRMGVQFRTGVAFGKEVQFEDLWSVGANAVILATGTMKNVKMGIQNEGDLEGCLDCLAFLRKFCEKEEMRIGARAIVIGGGNAAMDAARTALHLGAAEVTVLYRRSPEEMPADAEELEDAIAEGVRIRYLTSPVKVIGYGGKVEALECVRNELTEVDVSGRRRPVPIGGSEFEIQVDLLIPAVGQEPDYSLLEKVASGKSPSGILQIDKESLSAGMHGVFAAGDFVNGASTVVEAMASGRQAARAVMRFLEEGKR
jgi:NADPH-dependent glutamate synthase beta subunit-like oxidoreductase